MGGGNGRGQERQSKQKEILEVEINVEEIVICAQQ